MYCGSCGQQIPDGQRFCPNCGAQVQTLPNETTGHAVVNAGKPEKQPKKKRPVAPIVIAIVVVIVIVGAFGASSGTKPASVSGGSSASGSASQAQADYSNMAVGETVTLKNGMQITVNDYEVFTPQYSSHPVARINVTYVNGSSDTQSFNWLDWQGEDANGVEQSATIVVGAENALSSGDLKAGGTVSGNVYFDNDGVIKAYYYNNILLQRDSEVGWALV